MLLAVAVAVRLGDDGSYVHPDGQPPFHPMDSWGELDTEGNPAHVNTEDYVADARSKHPGHVTPLQMEGAEIADIRKAYGSNTDPIDPAAQIFAQQDAGSGPDYDNDPRYHPQYSWDHTENPRFVDHDDYVAQGNKVHGYTEPLTMDDSEI